jgi:hypothetical protein
MSDTKFLPESPLKADEVEFATAPCAKTQYPKPVLVRDAIVYMADGMRCAYCGGVLSPHDIRLFRSDTWDIVCHQCHRTPIACRPAG